jgi:hypothetical protein
LLSFVAVETTQFPSPQLRETAKRCQQLKTMKRNTNCKTWSRKLLFLYIASSILSCKNESYKTPSTNDIDKVILEAFRADYYSEIFDRKDLQFESQLKALKVFSSDSTFSHASGRIHISELLKLNVNGKTIFGQQDSAYIFYQNEKMKNYAMNEIVHKTILDSKKENPIFPINTISIPIFSLDQKHAYVQISHGGTAVGGGGFYLIFKNLNGHWILVKTEDLWDS